jgi:hypothetical protein
VAGIWLMTVMVSTFRVGVLCLSLACLDSLWPLQALAHGLLGGI